MAWNEPGGGPPRDPWNPGGRKGDGPPDLDEMLRRLRERFRAGVKGGGRLPSGGVGLVAGLLLAAWAFSGIYVVDEQERAVVFRLGAYRATTEPGLHWHIPWPIERKEKVVVTRVGSVSVDALILTQDENIVDIELAVQYRVSSAEDYLFNVRDPDKTLQQATKSALREVVGRSAMDFILTEGRQQVAEQTKQILQDRLDEYKAGLIVTEVNLQQAQPPEQVQGAFADAIKAREDQERLKNEAQAYANDRLPRARGSAARDLAESVAYRDRLVAQAEGEASRFTQLLVEYRKAPRVTKERLYLETMSDVLAGASKVLIDVDRGAPLIYLPLDQLLKQGARADDAPLPSLTPAPAINPRDTAPPDRLRDRGRR